MSTHAAEIGIDVSHYKKQINWRQVRESGVQFAFIKATEADRFVDPRFDYNWIHTRRQGIIRGAYHFFRPQVDPFLQAENYLRIVGQTLHQSDLPPVVDIEMYPDFVKNEWKRIDKDDRLRRIRTWLERVEAALGRTPIIYTEYYTWVELMGNTESFSRYPLWVANWEVDQPRIPANNWGGRGWTFWQTTDKGIVPGIRESAPCVDMNRFRGSYPDLIAWLGITGNRPLPPVVTNGDMMAALVDTAEQLGGSSEEIISRCDLAYLVSPIGNSIRPYDGPAVVELPLSEDEAAVLSARLDEVSGQNASAWSITHQDMINAFYYAASLEEIGGWHLVERAGLDYIGRDRSALYTGPVIEELPGLSDTQREAISAALGVGDENEDGIEIPEVEETVEPVVEESPEPTPAGTYGREVDNQAVINAFYLTAIRLDRNGRQMLASAGLEHLVDDRMALYTGPSVEEMPGLAPEERASIADLMGIDIGDTEVDSILAELEALPVEEPVVEEAPGEEVWTEEEIDREIDELLALPVEETIPEQIVEVEQPAHPDPVEPEAPSPVIEEVQPSEPTYPGLVNQDIINLFFKVAAWFKENGWQWLVDSGLGMIGKGRAVRFEEYTGPEFALIESLSEEKRAALVAEIKKLAAH